jgi:hypothetical protein
MNGKVKNLLHYPAGFLVDYQLVFDFRVFPVPDGSIGTDTLSCGKLRFESGLYLAARIFRKPFIEQRLFGKGKDKQAEIQYSCGFVAGWLPKS